ncbi:large subunit ribosomal protein L6e [Puccinia sorghi]|uniref:Large subunit ribosomal protein L6e n=1 Tax=Puccinia sorghi TaxID=27349 RepID=A0A0L6UDP8_9BASI|nr:large subunit ribosomal protein L6e [Puccinia sorghi]
MAVTKKTHSRNRAIGPHVNRLSKSQLYSKKALYKRPHKPIAGTKTDEVDYAATKTVKALLHFVGGAKNGGERLVPVRKAPRFYPTEVDSKPKKPRKAHRAPGLRSTLVPGTIVIILAGRFRGKRAVFLKQLESGLLMISGPFKVNGVPLRRVNQAYVIATQTKVDISGLKLDQKFNDAYFAKEKKTRDQRAKAKEFFAENGEREKKKCPDSRIADQKTIDKPLVSAIAQTPLLAKYLATPFSLSNGDFPHRMKF